MDITLSEVKVPKWNNVERTVKQLIPSEVFQTEEELRLFLEENKEYEVHTTYSINWPRVTVDLCIRGYAEMEVNWMGYKVIKRWLTDEEVIEYLKDSAT